MTTSTETPEPPPSRKESLVSTLQPIAGRLRTLHGWWTALPPENRRIIVAGWLRAATTVAVVWFLVCHGQQAFTAGWNFVRTGTTNEIIRFVVAVLVLYVITKFAMYLLGVAAGRTYCVPGEARRPLGTAVMMTPERRERIEWDRRRIAGHEAAHATVALALGAFKVEATTIPGAAFGGRTTTTWQTPTGAGAVRQTPTGTGAVSQQAWQSLVLTLAGHVYDVDHGVVDRGSHSDLDDAQKLAFTVLSARGPVSCACAVCCGEYRGAMTLEELMLHASDEARHLLQAHADGHSAIAAALNPPTSLSDFTLRELVGSVCAARDSRDEPSSPC